MEILNHVLPVALTRLAAIFSGIPRVLASSALLSGVLLVGEVALVGWTRSSLRRLTSGTPSTNLDIISALLVLSNLALLVGTVLSFGVIYLLASTFKTFFGFNLLDHFCNTPFSYFLYILSLDFANYWTHRWLHSSSVLWKVHLFHHSATEMTILNTLRDHPLERALVHGVNAIPAALLGVPPVFHIGVQLAMEALGYLKHSNFHSDWGPIGYWVIQSPAAHRLHHSTDSRYHNCNFASIFQFWDVMFGTAKQSRSGQFLPIGVAGEPPFPNPFHYLLRVTIIFYTTLFARRRTF